MKHIFIHGLGQTPASWDKTINALGIEAPEATSTYTLLRPLVSKVLARAEAILADPIPEVFEMLKAEGHQVGNHTYNHLPGFFK